MSDEQTPAPKKIEVTADELRRLLAKPENQSAIQKRLNVFDRNNAAYRLRDITAEVYQQRGINVQQHDQMRGYMKWQGTQHKMAYNLVLGLVTSFGGIKPASLAMHEKSWAEKNAAGIIMLVIFASMYFGFLYSPDFREMLTVFLAPLTTRLALAATGLVLVILYWRSRRRREQTA